MNRQTISIVIPIYNEAVCIQTNLQEIILNLPNEMVSYQLIFVDDGSTDGTWDKLTELANHIPENIEFNLVQLSRNFGKESALCAGLDEVKGDACIIMDGDLQHPPSLIADMIYLWKNQGYDVVEAIKASRGKEPLFNKIGAGVFYNLFKQTTGYQLQNASDYKLLDKKVFNAWQKLKESNTFFRGLCVWLGFKRTTIEFEVPKRQGGKSKWSGLKLCKLAINAIVSFSSAPLKIIMLMGNVFLLLAIVLSIQTLMVKIKGQAASGFTTVILLQLFIGSLILISLGIIGTYISKIYDEVKNRPRYIVRQKKHKVWGEKDA